MLLKNLWYKQHFSFESLSLEGFLNPTRSRFCCFVETRKPGINEHNLYTNVWNNIIKSAVITKTFCVAQKNNELLQTFSCRVTLCSYFSHVRPKFVWRRSKNILTVQQSSTTMFPLQMIQPIREQQQQTNAVKHEQELNYLQGLQQSFKKPTN